MSYYVQGDEGVPALSPGELQALAGQARLIGAVINALRGMGSIYDRIGLSPDAAACRALAGELEPYAARCRDVADAAKAAEPRYEAVRAELGLERNKRRAAREKREALESIAKSQCEPSDAIRRALWVPPGRRGI